MADKIRGADIVARTLEKLGTQKVFTLSGNHIMSIFDAALETKLELIHVRHEAATVHMADAWGRLTGEPGIAMVTGGPGHANAVGALYTALANESPMVLLSGHAATDELGRGGFQEIAQADLARPVAKASWTSTSAAALGEDVAKALHIARSGRPGPVHLSLPSDLLDEEVDAARGAIPDRLPGAAPGALPDAIADAVLDAIAKARAPLIIAAPHLSGPHGRPILAELEKAVQAPVVLMESPRGIRDATLGAFSQLLKQTDLIVLLGKPLDFTLKWAQPPVVEPTCRVISIDAEAALLDRAQGEIGERLALGVIGEARAAVRTLTERGLKSTPRAATWLAEARRLLDHRPESWATLTGKNGRLHAVEVFTALKPIVLRDPNTVLICDGGEFAQWGQSLIQPPRRVVNGVAGSIGAGIPFAVAARAWEPKAPIITVVGDGTFGFHMSEFDTAVRHNLPFVAIVGTDAMWNAESQIQLRDYGAQRMHGCSLLPTRYDQVVTALGGHGEFVEDAATLPAAIERAIASGKPACVNVMIEPIAAPVI
ncbi:MAG: thiamine pyrophosphate-binding protein [Hyphomicrobium sp.]|nr:thiamine pyrophosphate-binding protein [Hyphomicrobium sp.]